MDFAWVSIGDHRCFMRFVAFFICFFSIIFGWISLIFRDFTWRTGAEALYGDVLLLWRAGG